MPKRNTIINSIKNCIFSIGVILCSVIIISNPVIISKGVSQGIYNCRNIIIPSLFPFMILCIFINISPLVDIFCNFLKPVIKFVFGLPSNTSCLILMSFIGGYPMGARMVSEMLDKNQISKRVGERLIYFCVNAGPAFVVTAIGHVMWNDRTIGLIFLISHITGSVLIGFLLNVFSRDWPVNREEKILDVRLDYSSAFVKSVSDAVQVIIGICAFVVTFSVIITVFKDYKIIYFISSVISKIFFFGSYQHNIASIIAASLEITTGMNDVIEMRGLFSLLMCSFLISFSGWSIIFQILSFMLKHKISLRKFILFRFVHATFSLVITYILVSFLPNIKYTSFICGDQNIEYFQISPPISVILFFLSILFILFNSNALCNSDDARAKYK